MRWLRGGGQTDLPWRPTEPEKVRTFEALGHGMPAPTLARVSGSRRSTRRHFSQKLPVALDADQEEQRRVARQGLQE